MAQLKISDMTTAVQIFYQSPEIGNRELMELFACSRSTALKLKRKVQEEQEKLSMTTFSKSTVNTRLAYRVLGLDINDLEQRLSKYQKLKQKGVFSQE